MALTRYQDLGRISQIPFQNLPAAALRAVLREGYSLAQLRSDVLAGLVVGVVALPLAMALAIAVGVPPQQGLYTSIIAGFLVPVLGGSRWQVTGPTAAFIVILVPIFNKFGFAGLLISGLLAGFLLLGMGLARLGSLIEFIPHPVTTGFTAGIGTVIAAIQIKDLLGLKLHRNPEHFFDRIRLMIEARHSASLWELCIGLGTLAMLIWIPRWTKRVPAPILALPIAALISLALGHWVPGCHIRIVSDIPRSPPLPFLPWHATGPGGAPFALNFTTVRALMPSAFAVAMLGAIESLLSAVVADGMARTKHNPDSELLALGIGNIVAPFFGGIPATGAIARTATGIRFGATSPIASMVHALTVLGAVLALAPLLGYLPMTSLAALLLLVAWNMSDAKLFIHTVRVAPRSDVAVLLTCFGLTVAFDMVVGVSVGMVLAAFLFMHRMASVTRARVTQEIPDLPSRLPAGVSAYEISGPLFFGAAQKAMATLNTVADRSKAVILLMDEVPVIDVTGLVALESALQQLKKHKCLAMLSGVQAQPMELLQKAGVDQRAGVFLCNNVQSALAKISELLPSAAASSLSLHEAKT